VPEPRLRGFALILVDLVCTVFLRKQYKPR
jgi:hypothetical protein